MIHSLPMFLQPTSVIHRKDVGATSLQIESIDPEGIWDECEGGDEDEEDAEDQSTAKMGRAIIMLSCFKCTRCYKENAQGCAVWEKPAPRRVWWRNRCKVPNDCPLCHSVLFHKMSTNRLGQCEEVAL